MSAPSGHPAPGRDAPGQSAATATTAPTGTAPAAAPSAPPTPPAPTSASPTAHQLWRRARGLLIAATVLALAGITLAALRSGEQHGVLDPRSADRYGTLATAELLSARGVDTRVVTTTEAAASAVGPDTTLLVTRPDSLGEDQQTALRRAANRAGRTVLVAAGPASVGTLAPGVRAARTPTEVRTTPPDCDVPAARRAGDASLGGQRYRTTREDTDTCYLRHGLPTLVRLPGTAPGAPEDADTVLLGSPDPLYNDRLDERGNASLALQLLGSEPHLVWYLPDAADTADAAEGEGGSSFVALLPDGWSWGALQLAVAAVLVALWRARRLGPLVPERLPASVRASEATEGRARLYRTANARDRAAEALRAACRARLAPLVGVPARQAHSPDTLTPAVTARLTAGPMARTGPAEPDDPHNPHAPAQVRDLLFGAAPPDDSALIRLADQLDLLEARLAPSATNPSSPTDKDRSS